MAAKELPIVGYGPKLLNRVEIAEGTMAFHFEKPLQFDFKPGQSADVTLLNPPETDSEGTTRTFSNRKFFRCHALPPRLQVSTELEDGAQRAVVEKGVPLASCQVLFSAP
jgi:hypothetical protein